MRRSYEHPTLVVNIERKHFAAILATPRRKDVEWRDATPYWVRRLTKVGRAPFRLRLINGMRHPIPEATVLVTKVTRGHLEGVPQLKLHLGRVLNVRHWDRRLERPVG